MSDTENNREENEAIDISVQQFIKPRNHMLTKPTIAGIGGPANHLRNNESMNRKSIRRNKFNFNKSTGILFGFSVIRVKQQELPS